MTDNRISPGTLYIVSTPIGNLGDLSYRAVEVLGGVALIASEDTRNSGKLLAHYNIRTRQTSYHDHNERTKSEVLLDLLNRGESVALISDAGTPLVSDPGYTLVIKAVAAGIEVVPIPGASSILAALVVSGFPPYPFSFEGYPPKTAGKHLKFFEKMVADNRTIVFFETPHRITKSLEAMFKVLGDREVFIGRELTKKFEEKIRGRVSEVIKNLEQRKLKGEMVVIVRGQ